MCIAQAQSAGPERRARAQGQSAGPERRACLSSFHTSDTIIECNFVMHLPVEEASGHKNNDIGYVHMSPAGQ